MRQTSKVARHKFYNLFQNLKMSPIRSVDDVSAIPYEPGAFIFWIDEAPPRCLFVGIASPKLEYGLYERLSKIIDVKDSKSELYNHLAKDAKLAREYKIDLKKAENRERFLHDHLYFQYLPIADMKDDEMKELEEFLVNESELNPRYHPNSTPPPRKGK